MLTSPKVLIFLFCTTLCSPRSPKQLLTFSSEDANVTDSVKLPKDVLRLLLNDKEDFPDGPPSHIRCEDHEDSGDEPHPEILCRKLPLSRQIGQNYLIIGVGDLRGAHIVPFWIFLRDANGPSLLLKMRSDQLEISPKQWNGYAEIRSTWIQGAGATVVTDSFRFNGRKYVLYHRQTQRQ